jgi:hypothetical protein
LQTLSDTTGQEVLALPEFQTLGVSSLTLVSGLFVGA